MRKYLEANGNETQHIKLWDSIKWALGGNYITVKAYLLDSKRKGVRKRAQSWEYVLQGGLSLNPSSMLPKALPMLTLKYKSWSFEQQQIWSKNLPTSISNRKDLTPTSLLSNYKKNQLNLVEENKDSIKWKRKIKKIKWRLVFSKAQMNRRIFIHTVGEWKWKSGY